ncbi:MAG: hypothetical protein C7K11_05310 [Candidatus Amulumruptor caecigallinarius]|uniref:Uncharacterized protein n=1 Tax=Candidatus Amulumruptor caecigallinarius TaxID=2109911 RepID=A0A4Q0U8T8_9BACT|nr:MAG: hypothetical protein C7K11_05310 [Candidatus Amulumruptor caecigallinarius]HJE38316.1 hypothetical protein [Candidatus Amulumruptor caecigallinarius]
MLKIRRYAAVGCVALACIASGYQASAQTYIGDDAFDGTHKNEITGYLSAGSNIINGFFMGPAVEYKRHFTPRWSAMGATELQFNKQKYAVYGKGEYRLPLGRFNFYFSGKVMYNRYQRSATNEWTCNLSARWEGSHFAITVGETLINYSLLGSSYTEPLTFTFGAELNVMPRKHSWNIGLFFRNYDDFYYENWNINWGLAFKANLPLRLQLFGQFNIRPAGSMSQLASRYETSGKLGVKYVW